MLKECPRRWRECSVEKTAHNRQCVETIQEGPKLKLFWCGEETSEMRIQARVCDSSENQSILQDFNMVKIESRPQTTSIRQAFLGW